MILEQEGDEPNIKNEEPRSPGRILQEARQAKNITITDAANELRLSVPRLTSLEENKFADMGAVTFAKGYLRSYARFLGVSEEEVLQAFETMNLASDIPSHKPSLMNEKMTDGGAGGSAKASRRVTYLILLAVAVLAVFWWHNRESIAQSFLKMTSPAAQSAPLDDEEDGSSTRTKASEQSVEEGQGEEALSSPSGTGTYSLPVQPAEQQKPPSADMPASTPAPGSKSTASSVASKSASPASVLPEPTFDEHAPE